MLGCFLYWAEWLIREILIRRSGWCVQAARKPKEYNLFVVWHPAQTDLNRFKAPHEMCFDALS